jgi:3-hydroxypropanoate dehydrogenase
MHDSEHPHAINDEALDTIFRAARTQNKWSDKPVSHAVLMAVYDLMRWGPTAANSTPARFVFVTTPEAKERLKPHLSEGNREKTMGAPVIAIIGYDLDFPETFAKLFPNNPKMKDMFAGKAEMTHTVAFRNGSLQGAYFIIAARALGLDCGPSALWAMAIRQAFSNAIRACPLMKRARSFEDSGGGYGAGRLQRRRAGWRKNPCASL